MPPQLPDPPLTPVRHVVYLHGFASSPASSKARRFGAELSARGVGFACPDLNEPGFESLTVTRMVGQAREAIREAARTPVALVGSSLGAFVALQAAAAEDTGRVDRLVLLAPALDFGGNRLRRLGAAGVDDWRRTGRLRVFHYGRGEPADVGFGLYEDASAYDAFALHVRWPTLVFQGRRDDAVDPAMVERWCASRPHVALRLLEDDHPLTASIDLIWKESARWFAIEETGFP